MTHNASTLDALLLQRGRETPDQLLYRFLDSAGDEVQSLTLAQALQQAQQLAQALMRVCRPGDTVLLVAGPGAEHPLGLFACFLAGCTAVPLYPPQGEQAAAAQEAILAVARVSGARAWLANAEVAQRLQPMLDAHLSTHTPAWVRLDGPSVLDTTVLPLPGSQPQQPAMLLFTSGSTGQPKGVPLTHAGLIANLRAVAQGCGRGADDVVCNWLPQSHVAGLLLRLFPLLVGCLGVILPPQAFLAQPLVWLRAMSHYRASITAAPDFAYALCAQILAKTPPEFDQERLNWNFSSLTMAISGGEMVRPATLQAFTQALAPQGLRIEAFHPYYGLTETLCSAIPQGHPLLSLSLSRVGIAEHRVLPATADDDTIVLMGNGTPVGDTEIIAVHPTHHTRLAADEIGEIWLRGEAVTPGYVGTTLSPSEWQGRLADQASDAPAYFRTGDLGFVHQGQVFITGRRKELLIVRGKNHYPQDIESSVMQVARVHGAQSVAAFAVEDAQGQEGLGLAVERAADSADEAMQQALRATVAARHGLSIARLFLLPPGSLPRTPTQKIVRLACQRLLTHANWVNAEVRRAASTVPAAQVQSGTFGNLSGFALQTALLGRLLALLAEREGIVIDGDDLHRPLSSLGLSSLDVASLATQVRRFTGLEISLAPFFDQTTPWQWAEQLAQQMRTDAPAQAAHNINHTTEYERLLAHLPVHLPPVQLIQPQSVAATVLLTGATGFLGTWLLASLLQQGTGRVLCLVRAKDSASALARLHQALAQGPGDVGDAFARVQAIPGDLSVPCFGLDADTFATLAEQVDSVVHNAANVNFVAPYAALSSVNVDPLATLWPLLTYGGRSRALHFISTLAVFNGAARQGQQHLHPQAARPALADLYSGYAQSKWVAEAVLEEAARRGLPVTLHRPSLIVGDTRHGRSHLDDFVCRFLIGCAQWERWPTADITLDLVPVDEVARGVAWSVLSPDQASQRALKRATVRHWHAREAIRLEQIGTLLSEHGCMLQHLPLSQWLQELREALPTDNQLYPVHPFLLQAQGPQAQTLLEALDGLEVQISAATEQSAHWERSPRAAVTDVVRTMLAWLHTQGHLPTRINLSR